MIAIFDNLGAVIEVDFDSVESAKNYINTNSHCFSPSDKLIIVDFDNQETQFVTFDVTPVFGE